MIKSSGKNTIRPFIVVKESMSAKALQLWTGSGLFTHDSSTKERTTFFSIGSICLTIKDSPKMPPEKSNNEIGLQDEGQRS